MLATSQFGSSANNRVILGARWVLSALHDAARARGVRLVNCRWEADDDLDGDDRYVLTIDSGGVETWEPFEATDLEDLSISDPVRRSVETQLQGLLNRLAGVAPRT